MIGVVAAVGRTGIVMARSVASFPAVFVRRSGRADLFRQLYATGIRTLPVISVVALFTGMILALQVGLELARFNQEAYLGASSSSRSSTAARRARSPTAVS